MMRITLLLCGILWIGQAWAVSPEEQLADSALEERARDISAQMRCLVCQNQSIEDSDASLAKDLRLEIRRLLLLGDSDTEVIAAIQQKYGDYVLLNPPVKAETLLLWVSPVLIILIGGGILWQHFRKPTVPTTVSVSDPPIIETAPPRIRTILLMLVLVLGLSIGGYFGLERAGLVTNYNESMQVEAQINDMVEGLAERLKDEPDDLAGWQQLAQAYAVLDKPHETINALLQIARLMPEDWKAQTFPLELILARGLSETYQNAAQELLQRLAGLNPERLEYLFFAGHYAKLAGEIDKARAYWQKLYDTLPEDSPILQQLQDSIKGLGT